MVRETSQMPSSTYPGAPQQLPSWRGLLCCPNCDQVMQQPDPHVAPACRVCPPTPQRTVNSPHSTFDLARMQGSLPFHAPSVDVTGAARSTASALQLSTQIMDDRYTPSSGCTSPTVFTTDDSDSSTVSAATKRRMPPSSDAAMHDRRLARAQATVARSRRNGHAVEDYYCPQCEVHNCGQRGHRKNGNERTQRSALQSRIQTLEDILRFLCRFEGGKAQSSGNGTSSGLEHTKIDILDNTVNLLLGLLEMSMEQDIKKGYNDISKHFERVQSILGQSLSERLFAGYAENQCAHEGKQKGCCVHHTPDWTQCRKERNEALFKHILNNRLNHYRPNL